jgi:hypothetical protein
MTGQPDGDASSVAAHANSIRAVQITRLSLAASWFR